MKYKKPNLGPAPKPRANQTPRWRWHFNKLFPIKRAK